ncbi:hypothetical protein [Marinicella sp. W31]|uniref:delta-60 repeat domain-containing protein n=1 Tax=Marinicella sp. W31 TaxID=3023713 RepID=UPI0037567675
MQQPIKQWAMLMALTISLGLQAQNLDDGFKPEANDWVRALVQLPTTGDMLVGGRFTSMTNGVVRNRLARLKADGSIDPVFNPDLNGEVVDIGIQHDNKIIITGGFTEVNGITRNHIARLNPDGSVDMGFNPNADGGVWAMEIQPDGRIVIGGSFRNVGGQPNIRIARLLENGQLDPSFDAGAGPDGGAVVSMHIQPGGGIVIGGYFLTVDGIPMTRLARLTSSGAFDPTFTPTGGANGAVWAIQPQGDGSLLLGGEFTNIGGRTRNYLARVDANGEQDEDFFAETNDYVLDIAVASDGQIMIGGKFSQVNGLAIQRVARLNIDGYPDQSFGSTTSIFANNDVDVIAIQQDGKIMVGGLFTEALGKPRSRLARFYANGYLDDSLGAILNDSSNDIEAMIETSQGKTLIAGNFRLTSGSNYKLIQLNPDGTIDFSFDAEVDNFFSVDSLLQHLDSSVLASGWMSGINSYGIVSLLADGSRDNSFNVTTNGKITGMTLLPNSRILISGQFTEINGVQRSSLALISLGGNVISEFNVQIDGPVFTTAADPNTGRILIGGSFTQVNQFSRPNLARMFMIGDLPFVDTFNPLVNSFVTVIAAQPDSKVLIGGNFTHVNLTPRSRLARIHADGNLDNTLDLDVDGPIHSIALQANDRVLIAGDFFNVDGASRQNIARLGRSLFTGNQMFVDDTFIANTDDIVTAVSVQHDGKIMMGGSFTTVNGTFMPAIARLSQPTAALQSLKVSPGRLEWHRSGAAPRLALAPLGIVSGQIGAPLGRMEYADNSWSLPLFFDFSNEGAYIFELIAPVAGSRANGSASRFKQFKRHYFTDLIFYNGLED